MMDKKIIYTIGHSTRPLLEFIAMLNSFKIEVVADIRSYPGSGRFPQYNKETLEGSLADAGIRYESMKALGGRRKADPNSKNTNWRVLAFRGYADFMETEFFRRVFWNLKQSVKV